MGYRNPHATGRRVGLERKITLRLPRQKASLCLPILGVFAARQLCLPAGIGAGHGGIGGARGGFRDACQKAVPFRLENLGSDSAGLQGGLT